MIIILSVIAFVLLVLIIITIYYKYKQKMILANRPIQNQFDIARLEHQNNSPLRAPKKKRTLKQLHYIIIIQPDNTQNIGILNT
jgi:hypothetical protein